MAKHAYVIKTGRPEGFHFRCGAVQIRFQNRKFETDDDALAADIDAALQRSLPIRQNIMKLDVQAAAEIAKQHMAKQRTVAARGGFTAEMARSMTMEAMVGKERPSEALVKDADENDLVLTDEVPVAKTVSAAEKKSVGIQLGSK